MCSKCEDTENGEPVYQGILEVNGKQAETTEISSLKVRLVWRPEQSREIEM